MSKTIDERVVSMQFDNKQFEANVATTMSSVDKLKQKLNFTGAVKGLDNIGAATKNVNMTGLGAAVEQVHAKFSALEVMGVTALANITNSAVNAGKRIISALTIDPIKTGLSEYETKINAVQVIKANTRGVYESEEAQMEAIDAALEELNDYADRTIYNYTQMTNNVGKFVAQGLGVEEATKAVQGMANLAGASGASAEDMARATYQMSQALGGTIRKIDWNSLRNANMATVELKNTLMDLARVEGIDIDALIAKKGTFEDTLEEGWLTGDLFTEAMNIYSDVYSEAELKARGFTDEQIANFKDLAKTAQEATTEVKTMSQLWDVLKETAQSGWTKTWELIFGNFDEAKALFTGLQVSLSGFINKTSEWRNNILEFGLNLSKPWRAIEEKLGNVKKVTDNIGEVTDKLEYFQDVVTKVWRGDYNNRGDNPDRYDLLEKAGYDHRVVQDLVNLGYGYKLTVEDIEASHKKFGLTMDKTSDSTKEVTTELGKLTDEELENAGLTKEEINLYRALEKEAGKMGITVGELADKMSETDGRTLLMDSFSNLGSIIVGVGKAAKEAWVEIIDPPGVGEIAVKLYGILDALQKFTENLRLTDKETGELTKRGENIKRTLKGVFAIVDMVTTILAGPLKLAFKVISKLLSLLDTDIFAVTAVIGDAIVAFHDATDVTKYFAKAIEFVLPFLTDITSGIKDWIASLKDSKNLPKDIADGIIKGFGKALDFLAEAVSYIKNKVIAFFTQAPGDMVDGFANGMWDKIKIVGQVMLELGKAILAKFREVLGIHSPSTETHEDGRNFVQGFINGVKDFASNAWSTIKGFGSKCIETLKNIDFGAVFAGMFSIGMLAVAYKIASALSAFSAPFEAIADLGDEAEAVLKAFKGTLKSFSMSLKAKALKDIAIAVAILAGSIAVLTLLDPKRVAIAAGALAVLLGVMAGVVVALGKMGDDGVEKIMKFTGMMFALSGAMLILAFVVKIIGGMEQHQAIQGIAGLLGVITGLFLFVKAVSLMKEKDVNEVGRTLIKLGAAMLILVVVAKLIGGMSWSEMEKAAYGLGAMVAVILALTAITKLAGKDIDKVGGTIMKIGAAMLLLSVVAKIIAGMTWDEMIKAGVGIVVLGGIITGLIAATKLVTTKDIANIGKTILGVGAAMLMLAVVAEITSGMEPGELGKAALALVVLGGIITGLIAATRLAGGKDLKGVASTLLAMSVAIGIMAASVVILGFMGPEHLAKGLVAVSILAAMMSLMIYATKDAKDCKGNLIVMTVAIGVMTAAVVALSFIDPTKLAGATTAMTILMGMFALIAKAAGQMGRVMGSLIVMTVAIGVMAGAIFLVSKLPVESALSSAVALGGLMVALAISLKTVSKISGTALDALKAIGLLALLAVPLGIFIGAMALMSMIPNAMENAMGLAKMLGAFKLILIALTILGDFWEQALIGVGLLSAMVVPLFLFIGALYAMKDVSNAEENIKSLSTMLVVFTGVLGLLTIIGLGGPAAIIGIGSLVALIVAIGVLATSIGAAMQKWPNIQKFIDTGIPALEQLAHGLGSIVGKLFSGLADGLTDGLPEIGQRLTDFANNAEDFITKIKMVDSSTLEGVKTLTAAIIMLTTAEVISGIASMIQDGSSLAQLGTNLSDFMNNASDFIAGAANIKPEMMNGVKALADTILILTKADVLNGLTSWISGGSSLADFGAQLGGLGTNLNTFVTNLGTFDESKVATIDCAGRAIKALASAASEIPNEGGWAAKIFGENSIATFGEKLPALATNLNGFMTNIGTFDESKVATIDCAGRAIQALADSASKIPNDGGWVGKILGENSLATFGDNLPALGTNLSSFITNLGTFGEDSIATVDCAGNAIKALAEAAKSIPNEGGFWAKLAGDNSLATFGEKLPGLATNIAGFVGNLGTFGEEQIATVNSACSAIRAIAKLGEIDIEDTADGLKDLGNKMTKFAEKIADFVSALNEVGADSITSAVNKTNDVIALAKSAASTDVGSLKTFGSSLKDIATEGVEGFVNAFTSETPKTQITNAATKLLTAFVDGAKAMKNTVVNGFTTVADAAVTKLGSETLKGDFKSAGKDLTEGFANGITAKKQAAVDAASAVGYACLEAIKEALDSNSPSKETYKLGGFAGDGFVNALYDYTSRSYDAGYDMATTAKDGLRRAINNIGSIIGSDMDTQPTIRPVVDLSEVRASTSDILNMLNLDTSVGIVPNVKAISTVMNRRNQNGTNDDVVDAIGQLRKDLGNVNNTTYSINGITYNSDSDVGEAIETLVRAIRIEGRV